MAPWVRREQRLPARVLLQQRKGGRCELVNIHIDKHIDTRTHTHTHTLAYLPHARTYLPHMRPYQAAGKHRLERRPVRLCQQRLRKQQHADAACRQRL
jgi:hypothetical protein